LLDAMLVCVLWLVLNVMLICVVLYVSFLFEQHYVAGCSITSVVSVEYSIGLCVVII